MNKDLFSAFACRDMRAIDNNDDYLRVNKHIFNHSFQDSFSLTVHGLPIVSVVNEFYNEDVIESIDTTFLYLNNIDYTSDILFFIYILADVLNIDKHQQINSRLKYFAFKNIISLSKVDIFDGNQCMHLRNDLLSKLFFCHPTNEDYSSLFSIKQDNLVNSGLYYKNSKFDIINFFNRYINGLITTPGICKQLLLESINIETITIIQSFINYLLHAFLNYSGNYIFPNIDSCYGSLDGIFSNKQHPVLMFKDKHKFSKTLKISLKNYRVTSWDCNDTFEASLFYGPDNNTDIEKQLIQTYYPSLAEKYLSEYFIDSCIILLLKSSDNLKLLFQELDEIEVRHLLAILFSHPYFDYKARSDMSKNVNFVKALPDGFWKDEIEYIARHIEQ